MHELWFCQSILDILKNKCSLHQGKIKRIHLEMGELMAIDIDSLNFVFKVSSQGTIAEGALLDIKTVPGMAICDDCQSSVRISKYSEPCQKCGSFSLKVTEGETFFVKSISVV